jgi:YHS domain-containing protein
MNENGIGLDKKCPICGEIVRSDANVSEFCRLCGMGISDPESVHKFRTENGETLYFCCDYCLGIYKIEFDNKNHDDNG